MNYDEVKYIIEISPAVNLFKKVSLPLIISFLYTEFKTAQRVSIPLQDMRDRLESTLYALRAREQPEEYRDTASAYIDQWSTQFSLIRIAQRGEDYDVRLTVDGERVLAWFESLKEQDFVASESRLRTIYSHLQEVISRSTQDPQAQLELLEQQKVDIEAKISRIKETGEVEAYSPIRLKGRLQEIEQNARQLLRDFATIEEGFRRLALRILEEQLQPQSRKGTILQSVLNAHDALRNSEEGQSFYAFRDFLIHDDESRSLQYMLDQVYALDLISAPQQNSFLRHLVRYLLEASYQIDVSNRRLAQNLRYLLDERTVAENLRAHALIQDIKYLARQAARDEAIDPRQRNFLEIEEAPEAQLIMERPLLEPAEEVTPVGRPVHRAVELDNDLLQQIANVFYVDEDRLKSNIEEMLRTERFISLADLLRYFPIQRGMVELITYLTIASNDPRHSIDAMIQDIIGLEYQDGDEVVIASVEIPRVLYRRISDD